MRPLRILPRVLAPVGAVSLGLCLVAGVSGYDRVAGDGDASSLIRTTSKAPEPVSAEPWTGLDTAATMVLTPPGAPKKTIQQLAKEVLQGKWGNGATRKSKLTKAGYSYTAVQAEVNKLVAAAAKPAPKAAAKPVAATTVKAAPAPAAKPATTGVDCSKYASYPRSAQSNENRPGRPAACVPITGGTAAQRDAVRSYLKAYGTYTWIAKISLVAGLSHLGVTQACSPLTASIQLKSSMTGQQLKQVTAHEIGHAVLNYIYNGGCDYTMGSLAKKFGGYEQMTDCMAQAMTGSTAYLYNKPGGCSASQVALAKKMVAGHRV